MKANVIEIQVGGVVDVNSLEDACREFLRQIETWDMTRTKIIFLIRLPNGEHKQITIRDEGDETIAYGDFEGLPSMLDYAKEVTKEEK